MIINNRSVIFIKPYYFYAPIGHKELGTALICYQKDP